MLSDRKLKGFYHDPEAETSADHRDGHQVQAGESALSELFEFRETMISYLEKY